MRKELQIWSSLRMQRFADPRKRTEHTSCPYTRRRTGDRTLCSPGRASEGLRHPVPDYLMIGPPMCKRGLTESWASGKCFVATSSALLPTIVGSPTLVRLKCRGKPHLRIHFFMWDTQLASMNSNFSAPLLYKVSAQ